MQWDLTLERTSKNKLNIDANKKKLSSIAEAVTRNKALQFDAKMGRLKEPETVFDDATSETSYKYAVGMRLVCNSRVSEEVIERRYRVVMDRVQRAAKEEGWVVVGEITSTDFSGPPVPLMPPRPPFVLPELTDDVLRTHFQGVHEREAHIRIIHAAASAYVRSLERKAVIQDAPVQRSHVLLKGLPAGCKTTLFERFKAWYEEGSEVERVCFVDGPTMSKAGLENWLIELSEAGKLPEFVVIEEIEKQDMNNLLTLLSVMGSGYVAKLNARVKRVRALADVVIWATCNDEKIIRQFRNGAIWSRFSHKLHCARPTPGLMEKILLERVALMGGDERWAMKAMEFATQMGWTDPREIIALLDGGDRLLDGSYQDDIRFVLKSEEVEKLVVLEQ